MLFFDSVHLGFSATVVFPQLGAGPRPHWRWWVFGRGTCTAKRAPTHSDGAGPHPFSPPAPKPPSACAKNRYHLREPPCFPAVWCFPVVWWCPRGRANSPKCRTGGPVLRTRLGVAVRQVPKSACGAPQPSTQSAGRGFLCACLAAGCDGRRRAAGGNGAVTGGDGQ